MDPLERPRVLCVDDEPAVLQGLKVHLRRAFDVVTAADGVEGLRCVEQGPECAVVISDMCMPRMNGAEFLTQVRNLAPDSVRILLTGQADLDAALRAVNEGQIFRFLTKPCAPEVVRNTVDHAAEQYRLVRAERELLDQTLTGAVKALGDLLAIANPLAFGRASRLRRTVTALCVALEWPDRWILEVAAEFSQVGQLTLPDELVRRASVGVPLTEAERSQVERASRLGHQLLANIPRMEAVSEVLTSLMAGAGWLTGRLTTTGVSRGAEVVALAIELDALESGGMAPIEALAVLEAKASTPTSLIAALRKVVAQRTASTIREVRVADLKAGMVLAEDVFGRNGVLLVARGHTTSPGMLARLQNFSASVKEPVKIVAQLDEATSGRSRAAPQWPLQSAT